MCAFRHGAGEITLERVLNLDVFGWGGASALTKLMYWLHRQYFIITLALAILYWDLPQEQWLHIAEAVLYAWLGILGFSFDIHAFQPRGRGMF